MPPRRRQRPQRRGGEYDEGYGPPPPRRKSGNEGLYIALGIAAVVGLVVLLIIMGSDSGENDAIEARAVLRQFFEAALNDRPDIGEKLVNAREILRDQNPNETKRWSSLSKKEQDKLTTEAFRWVRGRVMQSLQLGSMAQVDTLLNAATADPWPGEGRVDFQWKYLDETWNAVMVKSTQGWVVERLDRRE